MDLMIGTIKWWYSDTVVEFLNKINASILIIAGVSGAGKSYLTDYLSQHYTKLSVIKNHTTRPPRTSDNKINFEYVSEKKFGELLAQDAFFLQDMKNIHGMVI